MEHIKLKAIVVYGWVTVWQTDSGVNGSIVSRDLAKKMRISIFRRECLEMDIKQMKHAY